LKNWKLDGRIALLRVDFNVPLEGGVIRDNTRIVRSLETIRYLTGKGARLVIFSHLGRPLKSLLPDGSLDTARFSLKPIAEELSRLLGTRVDFASDCGGPDTLARLHRLPQGGVLLLENTRFRPEEEKGNSTFARELASLGDFFVNDAFGAAHREHATTATIARFFDRDHKSFGFLMQDEVDNALRVLRNPEKPCTAILGGAKVSDKIELIDNLMQFCNAILIGGGMAYTFLRAQGYETGSSLCESDKLELALSLLERARQLDVELMLPTDGVVASSPEAGDQCKITEGPEVPAGSMGLDIGPRTLLSYAAVIRNSKTLLWNGPMGVFERQAFSHGTRGVAEAIAEATSAGAYSLVGGGDSVAAIHQFGLASRVSFVSTGGGAMLEMLEGRELPGIAAILH